MSQTDQTEQISGRKTFTVSKPLGVVLEELESGSVFVASVAGDGNAGEVGILKGDLVIGVDSKLFAGKGLETVMSAINEGSSDSVELLVERTISVPTANKLDDKVREKLRSEISAPYRQNWVGIMVVAVLTLIVLARFSGIR
ncbi:hypothetical protein NDN08_005470 [Rhodosorus marinus]|uniref:PDZ domain-containing protein n=1 Tax=Rhodosorus marinus TaxID=101924 RepID=A0AAV8V1N7_9RHOD|nr:hypothetical protein NDN08_005470 [Rhodosorus marinus]